MLSEISQDQKDDFSIELVNQAGSQDSAAMGQIS
jgi:hypothetical protein